MAQPQYGFGIGTLLALRTDIAAQTPAQFGTLQDVSLDLSFTVKELMGQYQAPVALARGGLKITGKAKAAKIAAVPFNNIFFGQTIATGSTLTAVNEVGTVPAVSTYTVTSANSATWVADGGVFYAATGLQLTPVASGPTVGQYSVASGVYTFAAADASAVVLLTYTYTSTTVGKKITISNQLMGSQPSFQMILNETYQGQQLNVQLNYVIAPKLALAFKNEDFVIPEFDFQAGADSAGTIGYVWTTN